MKKTFLFGVMCFFAVAVSAQFVDLGLPSGTLWKDANEAGWHAFGDMADVDDEIPSQKQWEELLKECTWECQGDAYRVTGPNGKSIFFSLEGYRIRRGGHDSRRGKLRLLLDYAERWHE